MNQIGAQPSNQIAEAEEPSRVADATRSQRSGLEARRADGGCEIADLRRDGDRMDLDPSEEREDLEQQSLGPSQAELLQ